MTPPVRCLIRDGHAPARPSNRFANASLWAEKAQWVALELDAGTLTRRRYGGDNVFDDEGHGSMEELVLSLPLANAREIENPYQKP